MSLSSLNCRHFGICNSCINYEGGYEAQLERKLKKLKELFAEFWTKEFEVFRSYTSNFRDRAEFKAYKEGNKELYFALRTEDKKFFMLKECEILSAPLNTLVKTLPSMLAKEDILRDKLFEAELLGNGKDECILNLIYHKKLNDEWEEAAQKAAQRLNIGIIGRSKGETRLIGDDFVTREFAVGDEKLRYIIKQNCFSQPNGGVNEQMLLWATKSGDFDADLLELYCGSGNFTVAFAKKFRRVFATEVVKEAIQTAKNNIELNALSNVYLGRLSAKEVSEALLFKREFNRLKGIDLREFNFKTLFVDPPRAGLEEEGGRFASEYENIVYISCNPQTLKTDLGLLNQTHDIVEFAAFDQFAYTNHLECGVKLKKRRF